MLHELEVLETRRIADLALDVRKLRRRTAGESSKSQISVSRGRTRRTQSRRRVPLNSVLEARPEFVAPQEAIVALPREIREKLWVVARIGRGDGTAADWEQTICLASLLTDGALAVDLLDEPDLHDYLSKGLYELGAAKLPGDGS